MYIQGATAQWRIYFTNSLYSPWDEQIYPDGLKSWMVKLDAGPNGGMKLDEKFFVEFDGQQIGNCTNAIADGQPSKFLVAKLSDLERELDAITEKIRSLSPDNLTA